MLLQLFLVVRMHLQPDFVLEELEDRRRPVHLNDLPVLVFGGVDLARELSLIHI